MAPSTNESPQDEVSRLNYIENSDLFLRQKPYEILSEVPEGCEKSNFKLMTGQDEIIHDMRGREDQFDLDNHGFQVMQHTLETTEFDEKTIKMEYIPAIELLLKGTDPETEVYVFDWRVHIPLQKSASSVNPIPNQLRSSALPTPQPGSIIDLNDPGLVLKPVQAVHVDQSPRGAMKQARNILGNRLDGLENKRIRIVNIWRPIRHPVDSWPLAVCDGSTVPQEKLLAVDHVRKYYVGESLYPIPSLDYRWYYLNRQTRNEVILFKNFDSKADVLAKCCPHTSFMKEIVSSSSQPRESIELRALVISPS
ncbi:unnamed protein product [Clonostachys rosea]|uniref:Methyltransferase n=1 Tax=Bionectria ochroleuca TaxID=29856 RepID=A0ABY6U771_BIOOC|nr:unnamed protein product [Clonostachys rosea]